MNNRWVLLIVDDALEDRKTYKRYLEQSPDTLLCSIVEASTGEEALACFKEHLPDCVLLDFRLPDYNGLEILERFQQDLHRKPTGIVMLTGDGDTALAVNALKLGAHDYLDKDRLSPPQLRRAVTNAIEKVQLQARLTQEREWLRATLASIGDGIIATDSTGWVLFMNDVASKLTGWYPEDSKNRPLDEIFRAVNGSNGSIVGFPELHGYGDTFVKIDQPLLIGRQGTKIPIDITSAPILNARNERIGMVLVFRDISERLQFELALYAQKERLKITLASIGEGVIATDAETRIESMNSMAERLTGWTMTEAKGQRISKVFTLVNEDAQPLHDPALCCIQDRSTVQLPEHSVLKCRDGREVMIDDTASPILDNNGKVLGAVVIFRDVTAQRQHTKKISHEASHDSLTGLLNRKEFERRLELLLQRAKSQQRTHALGFLDLDQFKVVNDTCGHIAGDELLRQLTSLVKVKMRDRDTFARLGGDEFGLLLGDCPFDQAVRIATDVRDIVEEFRFSWEGKIFTLGVSIGLVPINADSTSASNLLSDADHACYVAKEAGGNRIHIFKTGDRVLDVRRGEMEWVGRLQQAIVHNDFCLYQQPIIPLHSDNVAPAYCECLLRLVEHNGDILLPGAFLPAAERYHQMLAIDRWVIRSTLSHIVQTQQAVSATRFAINVSGQSLASPEFLDYVVAQLDQNKVPRNSLCFEITETAAIANLSAALTFIETLKDLGCCFTLDDFGSGLSSFSYLKKLPVDYVKIDGACVKDIHRDPVDYAMVEAIHRVGKLMGLVTIAEWVENDEILHALKSIGVDYVQGYVLGSPRPMTSYH